MKRFFFLVAFAGALTAQALTELADLVATWITAQSR